MWQSSRLSQEISVFKTNKTTSVLISVFKIEKKKKNNKIESKFQCSRLRKDEQTIQQNKGFWTAKNVGKKGKKKRFEKGFSDGRATETKPTPHLKPGKHCGFGIRWDIAVCRRFVATGKCTTPNSFLYGHWTMRSRIPNIYLVVRLNLGVRSFFATGP